LFLKLKISPDKETNPTIEKMPPMINSHLNHSMIATNNYIFVISEYNSNKCEAFNLKTLQWESLSDLNWPERQRTILAINGDYLYAFIGYNKYGIFDNVERINIKNLGNNKWKNIVVSNPNNNLNFYGVGIYYWNNKLYFICGKVELGNNNSDYKHKIRIIL